MKIHLPARDRRAVTWGALLLAPVLAWKLAVAPYLRASDELEARLAAEQARLQSELEMLAQMDAYPPLFRQSVAAFGAVQPRLLTGGNRGAMGAALASYLQSRARQSGALIANLEPLDARPDGRFAPVAIKVAGETDTQGLLELLQSLESGPLLIHVDRLRISRARAGSVPALAGVGPAAAGAETIAFEFVAKGFMISEPPVADSAGPGAGG